MRKSDYIYLVTSVSRDVLDVEIRTADDDQNIEPGTMFIIVTTDLPEDQQIDLRMAISERVSRMIPAGIGLALMFKNRGDAVRIIGVTEKGPVREAVFYDNAEDVNRAYAYQPEPVEWPLAAALAGTISPEVKAEVSSWMQRTRFDAVADELTADIAPLKKLSVTSETFKAPRLFEQTIDVKDRTVSPCLKCSNQAFSPVKVGSQERLVCRGCPPPAPSYVINQLDAWGLSTNKYQCSSCGKVDDVTMLLSEINLHCERCQRLTLHIDFQTATGFNKKALWARAQAKTTSFAAAKARITFNGKVMGTASDVTVEISEEQKNIFKNETLGEFVPAKSESKFTMTAVGEVPKDWVQAIERMNLNVAAEYGMTFEEQTSSPAAGLIELFRNKLGLKPFREFAAKQVQMNQGPRGLKARDWERQTGRTTRGMLFAIAEFMVSQLRMFCVVGLNERYTKDLANLARDVHAKLNLARDMPVKALLPGDYDPTYDYTKSQSAKVFVDHSYAEKMLNR